MKTLEDRNAQFYTDLQTFLASREEELKLPLGSSADILVAALVTRILEVSFTGLQPPQAIWDEANRVCTLRLSDVTFSMTDWVERKVPWRWQSKEMRARMAEAADAAAEAQVQEIRPNGRLDS